MRTTYAALALLLLVGCGSADVTARDDPVGSAGNDAASALEGAYVVTAIEDSAGPREPVSGTQIRLWFTEAQLRIQAGCNHIGGTWSREGDQLEVEAMSMTEMGCDRARHEQDEWLVNLFEGPVRIGADPLTLTSGDVVLTLAPLDTRTDSDVRPDQPTAR